MEMFGAATDGELIDCDAGVLTVFVVMLSLITSLAGACVPTFCEPGARSLPTGLDVSPAVGDVEENASENV